MMITEAHAQTRPNETIVVTLVNEGGDTVEAFAVDGNWWEDDAKTVVDALGLRGLAVTDWVDEHDDPETGSFRFRVVTDAIDLLTHQRMAAAGIDPARVDEDPHASRWYVVESYTGTARCLFGVTDENPFPARYAFTWVKEGDGDRPYYLVDGGPVDEVTLTRMLTTVRDWIVADDEAKALAVRDSLPRDPGAWSDLWWDGTLTDDQIELVAARSPDPDVALHASFSPRAWVRAAAATNAALPASDQARLAVDPVAFVRVHVCRNPQINDATLSILANDPAGDVAVAVTAALVAAATATAR